MQQGNKILRFSSKHYACLRQRFSTSVEADTTAAIPKKFKAQTRMENLIKTHSWHLRQQKRPETEISKNQQFRNLPIKQEFVNEILSFGEVRRHKIEKRPEQVSAYSCDARVEWVCDCHCYLYLQLFDQKMTRIACAANSIELPKPNLPEIVFAGRSNVGKSSLINAIAHRFVVKTSYRPGETQQLTFYKLGMVVRNFTFC